jgi:hypothetical protein
MKPIVALLMLTALALTAHASHAGRPAVRDEARASAASQAMANPGQPHSTASRPAHKERSRRTARIDLTMPFYRFGRLPIRIKD